ncbi:hypothetical protein OQA88_11103 [Cercophora sp. LCS_1]
MAMPEPEDRFFVFENRLASFQGAQVVTKRRASNASSRAPKIVQWPHKSLSPVDLARAGFFFEPFSGSPDNVVCFLCNKSLDGWEDEDKPLEEHLKHSPTCGWAIMAAIDTELGDFAKVHPLDPGMVEARKATFGGRWPYESKKGFKCKTKQLAEAGWKYTPTLDSDDMATCAYCDLALDGDEHYKRAPNCPFFQLISQYPPPKKAGRAKAARASKASRLSVQSVATIATAVSDLQSVADITADHDDSVMTTTSTMAGKKTAKGKKATAPKARKTRAKKDEAVEIVEDEPEQVPEPLPQKPTRGRKRASDAMEDGAAAEAEAPPPKKRAGRAKATPASQQSVAPVSEDVDIVDAPPAKVAPKRGRASTKTAVKTTRKASQSSLRSQASTASLRAQFADDEEIDRQLQADLERPLTDDENIAADSDSERRQAPAPAKGRKKATTRKASGQKQQSKAYAMLDPTPMEPTEAEVDAELNALENEMAPQEPPTEQLVVPKKGRKPVARKVSKQTKKAKEVTSVPEIVDDVADELMTEASGPEPVKEAEVEPEAVAEHETTHTLGLEANTEDPDVSTGTVVNKTGRQSIEKRGRGRPRKTASAGAPAEPEPESRRSSGIPVQIEVQLQSSHTSGSLSKTNETREPIARKPVPAKAAPVQAPASPLRSRAPSPDLGATPPRRRTDRSLPPPPSSSRLPRPTTPRTKPTPSASAKQATISPSQSPQSSDAENQPPSANLKLSAMPKRVVLAPVTATPMRGSPSKRNVVAGLQSNTPWDPVDLDMIFSPSKDNNKENAVDKLLRMGGDLTSPEKKMTVEEWIYHNAGVSEAKLKHECESLVSRFEREGMRAVRTLEELVVD